MFEYRKWQKTYKEKFKTKESRKQAAKKQKN